MKPRWDWLLPLCLWLALLPLSKAEKVYHSRDHSDIQERAWTRARPVLTVRSAQEYLDKYGWTEPVNWEDLAYQGVSAPVYSALEIPRPALNGHHSRRNLPEPEDEQQMPAEYTSALLRFQRANGLPTSGLLDQATMEAMNMPRCGVPDHKAHDDGMHILNATRYRPPIDSNVTSTNTISPPSRSNAPHYRTRRHVPARPTKTAQHSLQSTRTCQNQPHQSQNSGLEQLNQWVASSLGNLSQSEKSMRRRTNQSENEDQGGLNQQLTSRQVKQSKNSNKGWLNQWLTNSRVQLIQSEHSMQNQSNQSVTTSQEQVNQSGSSGRSQTNQSRVGSRGVGTRWLARGEEAEPDPGAGRRTMRWLVEQMRRRRAASDLMDNTFPQLAFTKSRLRWRILDEGYSSQLTIDDQKMILRLAFRMWSEVTPLIFIEDLTSPASEIDIKLGFGTKRHLGCSQVFDGTGQEYAHAWRLGDVHFDDDEHFVKPSSNEGISLLTVAVHEIGHVLGLPHIQRAGSIMHPNYIPHDSKELELDWFDRKAIQQIYGVCEGSFNTVFDWVRREENTFGEVTYRFNTYFMRRNWYWMYENRFNRTRYGDPIPLVVGWRGLPAANIDGFAHIWTWNKDITLFFKGTMYWQYDNDSDRAYSEDPEGNRYPRPISQGFPGVQAPIDTVFFDKRDHCLYFFRGFNVTAFSVQLNATMPEFPKRIIDVFPAIVEGDHPLGQLDAAYYSYTYAATFLFKGTAYWRVVNEEDRESNASLPLNGLLPHHRVTDRWFDICEVDGSWAPGRP
ncbi:matrix metalloproteinase-21-like [Mobula hypostoma]|uniref:matrix metalloproteinase-21-like n=1 Tax=Mobula hypostoma TaxID=723540 RepID=UPI002FC3D3C8